MRLIKANESTAARRYVFFHLVDATDGITAETGEAGGQPQVSSNGGAWTNTGIGTLTSIGNGRYYAELTQTLVQTAGTYVETRYKSANTAECPGDSVHVVGFDPNDGTSLGISRIDAAITSRQATVTFPANFGDLAITASTGRVTAGTVSDKTGYSLATAPPTASAIADAVFESNYLKQSDGTTNWSNNTFGQRLLRSSSSQATVQVTGSNHVSADVHAFQASVIDNAAFAADALAATNFAASVGQEFADAILGRNIAGGSDGGRMVKDALRFLRNRFTLVGDVLTVYAEDDTTIAWTAVVSTDEAALPITGSNPAGGAA